MNNDTTLAADLMRMGLCVSLLVAGGCKPAASPYDKLCAIYESVAAQPDDSLDWFALSNRIASEAPDIADDHNSILLNQPDARYELFRKRASERAKQRDWQCDAIRKRWPPQE